jgi:hypothetical protein
MSKIDSILEDIDRTRSILNLMERELIAIKKEQLAYGDRSLTDLRKTLKERWVEAQKAQPYPKLYAVQWLSRESAYNLARAAGFEKMCDAADFLNGVGE